MKEFLEEKAQKELSKKQKKFSSEDITKLLSKGQALKDKFKSHKKLSKFLGEFKLLFSMIKDYAKGNYKTIPWYIISSIGATLLYVLLPFDAIPDFIPGLGYIDDAAVFSLCLRMASTEIERYRKWKITGDNTEIVDPTI